MGKFTFIPTTNLPLDNKLLVTVSFRLGNRNPVGQFIVDTGASQTVLDDGTAQRLKLVGKPGKPFLGIGQQPVAKTELTLDSLTLGQYRSRSLVVGIADIWRDDILAAGILGMDILGRFNWGVQRGQVWIEMPNA